MASLIKKAPALLATAREVATPKLNTFWRYAKVGEIRFWGDFKIFFSIFFSFGELVRVRFT